MCGGGGRRGGPCSGQACVQLFGVPDSWIALKATRRPATTKVVVRRGAPPLPSPGQIIRVQPTADERELSPSPMISQANNTTTRLRMLPSETQVPCQTILWYQAGRTDPGKIHCNLSSEKSNSTVKKASRAHRAPSQLSACPLSFHSSQCSGGW